VLTQLVLPGSWHIAGFLLSPKIFSFSKPTCLALAALQITFRVLVH
jgi:hypothetical protein